MSLISAFRRGALFLLLGGNRFSAHAFSPATIHGRSSFGTVVSPVALHAVPQPGTKRSMAKRIIKGVATRALKTIPPVLVAGGAFPQSALALTANDYISHTFNKRHLVRNLVGVGTVAATWVQIIRVSENPALCNDPPITAMSMSTEAASAAEAEVTSEEKKKKPAKIPITILAGFLGAGKTTALKRLLENTEGIKVGTIVNDVASVNIDAKLISNPMNSDGTSNAVGKDRSGGTVELQNGCACCSLSDELLTSVSELMEGRELDSIVIELSGVADPAAVQTNWKQAVQAKHPATELADLGRVVTVVDSHTFGSDWMTWDTAGKREWTAEGDDCAGSRQVPELLAEQVEAADVIILNKIDLSEGEQLDTARLVVRSLNEKAEFIETKFGEMTPDKIIGSVAERLKEVGDGHSHGHDHSSHEDSACSEPGCTDTSHSHSHEHQSEEASCSDPSHSHDHSHSEEEACVDPGCSDTSHSHSHSHSSESECVDPECTDTSHSHSHDHKSTAADSLGISNFVYKSSRPFEPRKLQKLLMNWPIPVMEELKLVELSKELEKTEEKDEKSPFVGVLRSKGFAWVAPSIMSGPFNDLDRHDTAFYWSHAGKHFGLKEAGSWWASMGKDAMKKVFEGNLEEFDRIIREDFIDGSEWGDRRQEIVFIGAKLDEKGITDALDSCLCTDEQVGEYKQGILDAINEYYAESK
ncbi:hypothetical protein ACHAXR_006511 [Thalassiosira sp. AJA248-18]